MFRKSGALLLLAALVMALPLLAACASKEPAPPPPIQVVQVQLAEHHIQMPEKVAPGKTTFKLTNTGTMRHSFEIDGPAGEKALETSLEPGQSATLEVELDPGTYRVFCPLDQHQNDGMQLALQVNDTAAHS